MKITLRVVGYNKQHQYHYCVDENKGSCRVDLMVNGDFPQDTDPQSLVGNTYEIDYKFPIIELAIGVNPNKVNI